MPGDLGFAVVRPPATGPYLTSTSTDEVVVAGAVQPVSQH